jgi:multicomponent Na+:H+ antiporter subunit D
MVELGLFAVARVYWTVFRVPVAHHHLIPDVLLWLGLATALVGAAMSFLQRHLKRMLAYSTISHAGIMLAGVALLGTKGLAGAANMVLSHGLLKGALFLIGGILLSMFGEVDELRLHGRGRALPGVGVLFGIAAVGLIGVPYVGTFLGHDLIDQSAAANGSPWVGPIVMVAAGISAGAILRAGARIFLGWGGTDDSFLSPEPPEQVEGEDASMPVMVAVIAVMVALGTVASVIPGLEKRSEHAAERFRDHGAYVDRVLHGVPVPAGHELPFHVPLPPAESFAYAVGAALVALATAALGLWWRRLGRRMWYLRPVLAPAAHGLRAVHSGLIGDYVTWLTVGAAAIGVVFALELR